MCVRQQKSFIKGKRRVLQEKTGGVFADYLKGVGLFGQHFLSFPAISSLDANSLAVYKEVSTYKSYLRFTLSPSFHEEEPATYSRTKNLSEANFQESCYASGLFQATLLT